MGWAGGRLEGRVSGGTDTAGAGRGWVGLLPSSDLGWGGVDGGREGGEARVR